MTNDELKTLWREQVESPLRWRRAANQAGAAQGICQGFYATSDSLRRRVYLKPTISTGTGRLAIAAREKIAADIAFDLNIPVPPVVLAPHVEGLPSNLPVCISLVLYPSQALWNAVDPTLGRRPIPELDVIIPSLMESASRALVFDTWVDQIDHGEGVQNNNVILGYSERFQAPGLVFLDYEKAFSAGYTLGPQVQAPMQIAAFPNYLRAHSQPDAIQSQIKDIMALRQDTLEQIIYRIPPQYLDPDEGSRILDLLLQRREGLEGVFNDFSGGTP